MTDSFDYEDFTGRNIGFVTEAEQGTLRRARVFICGVGGMGGACLASLVRAGIETFVIADIDTFEVSNLNRQVFATLNSVGQSKTEATVEAAQAINPNVRFDVHGGDWVDNLGTILSEVDIIVNGTDDIAAGVRLYRAAAVAGLAVIDAYAAPLPSVYVTRAQDPRLEQRLKYPTLGKDHEQWTEDDIADAFLRELEYVMACSSSRHHVDLSLAGDMAAGRRPRMSFAPMVITTGNLMAYEAVERILGRAGGTDRFGYFFNPYMAKIERPPPAFVRAIMLRLASRSIARLMGSP